MTAPPRSDSGEVTTAASATLTLTLLAERIASLAARQAAELATEREVRVDHEAATEKARELQATEYERRLTVLNHAHEAAQAMRQTTDRQAQEALARTVQATEFQTYVRETKAAMEARDKASFAAVERREAETDRRLGLLEVSAIEIASRTAGSKGVQNWIAPNLGGLVALALGLIALYLALRSAPQ